MIVPHWSFLVFQIVNAVERGGKWTQSRRRVCGIMETGAKRFSAGVNVKAATSEIIKAYMILYLNVLQYSCCIDVFTECTSINTQSDAISKCVVDFSMLASWFKLSCSLIINFTNCHFFQLR